MLIEAFGWRDVTAGAGAVAAVVLPLGIGELVFFFSQRDGAGFKS